MNDIHEASKMLMLFYMLMTPFFFSSLASFNVALNKYVLSTDINNELSKIQEWLNTNKLSLNVSKTKYIIIFHNHQRNIDSLIPDIRIKK